MATVAKDAAQQLYRSVFAILKSDTALRTLMDVILPDENPKIYQTFIDFKSASEFKDKKWITFNSVNDRPMEIEQMQDVHEITLDIHVWQRGPGSDAAEDIEKRVRELLDNADLSTDSLFSWFCHSAGYTKTYEATPELWHVTGTYHVLCMAITPT